MFVRLFARPLVVFTVLSVQVLAFAANDLAPAELPAPSEPVGLSTDANQASLDQSGTRNTASIVQLGTGNVAKVVQGGTGDWALIRQEGTGHNASIVQMPR